MTAPKNIRQVILALMAAANCLISLFVSSGFMGTEESKREGFFEDPVDVIKELLIGEVILSTILCLFLSFLIFGLVYFIYYREKINYVAEISKTLLMNVFVAIVVAALIFYHKYCVYGYV